jgi:hypothetical protein
VIFGVLRHHGGTIAEENRFRSPVSGSVRLSLTLQRLGQHPPRALPDDLIDQRRRAILPAFAA